MEVSTMEHYCSACGFLIVTKGPYHPTCPICGEALGHKKVTSSGRKPVENKKQSAKEKKVNGTEIRNTQKE